MDLFSLDSFVSFEDMDYKLQVNILFKFKFTLNKKFSI